MNEKILRMYSPEGFREVFLEELHARQKLDLDVTREQVFDALNNQWREVFGNNRYSNYNSFRRVLQRSYQYEK